MVGRSLSLNNLATSRCADSVGWNRYFIIHYDWAFSHRSGTRHTDILFPQFDRWASHRCLSCRQTGTTKTDKKLSDPKSFFCFLFCFLFIFFGMTKKRRRSPGWGNLDRDDKGNSLVSSHANGHIIQVGRLKKRTGIRTVRIGRPHTIVTIVDFWATRRLLLLPL